MLIANDVVRRPQRVGGSPHPRECRVISRGVSAARTLRLCIHYDVYIIYNFVLYANQQTSIFLYNDNIS